MSYVETILQPSEKILHVSRIHWFTYLPGLSVLLVGVFGLLLQSGLHPDVSFALRILSVLIILYGLALLGLAWLKRWTTEIAVTDRRIIYKRGLIWRSTVEMNMEKVESVGVNQSILGRIFDFGDIHVRGTGVGLEHLHGIDQPLALRNSVTAR